MCNVQKILRSLAQDFRLAGDSEMANKAILAMSAMSGNEEITADISYSYLLRELRKNNPEKLKEFMKCFKDAFDRAYVAELDDVEEAALLEAIQKCNIKINDLN